MTLILVNPGGVVPMLGEELEGGASADCESVADSFQKTQPTRGTQIPREEKAELDTVETDQPKLTMHLETRASQCDLLLISGPQQVLQARSNEKSSKDPEKGLLFLSQSKLERENLIT